MEAPGAGSQASRTSILLEAALALAAEHDLEAVLGRIVTGAAAVAGARYAALGIYDRTGAIRRFVHHGVEEATAARIGSPPRGRGLLGEAIVSAGPVRAADISTDPRSAGFPPHHPLMHTFLGVPLTGGGRRWGNLYVADKAGGGPFDEEDEHLLVALAAFAAAAVESAELVVAERELAAARERERSGADLMARVIDAQEAERARVARDLHDDIGQALTSVLLGLRLVEGEVAGTGNSTVVKERIDEVRALVADALGDVRRLAFDLRPTVLDDLGLVAALERLVAETSTRHALSATLDVTGTEVERRLRPELETVVYRVVQEALTNVARHAKASAVAVRVTSDGTTVHGEVADDGAGFDPLAEGRSLGLAGMRERAALAGGSLRVVSAPGEGTCVVLDVPVG